MNQMEANPLKRQGFWALCLTLFLVAYNVSVVPPIMPQIVRDLDSSIGYVQSALVLFSLVTASFAPTTENLCRYYGRTRVFRAGLILYGIGIALTSLSPEIGWLVISFSLLTGLAATPLISTPWAISDLVYDGKAEEQATLALLLASTIGGLSGGLIGGFIASKFGWRWAFAPSLITLVALLPLARFLPDLPVLRKSPIDWVGGLFSFLGLGSILLGIGLAGEYGWWEPRRVFSIAGWVIQPFSLSIVPTLITSGVVFLGLFMFWQRQQAARSATSLMRIGLLRKRVFVVGALTAMLHTLITTGVQFNLYQFVPFVLKLDPFRTALTVLPYTLTMIVVVIALLKYLTIDDQFPPKYVIDTGIVLLGVGIGLLYTAIKPGISSLALMPGLIFMGIGSGLFLAYIGALTYSAATADEKPEGSGIYNPIQNLGSSLGRGILGSVLILFTSRQIVDGLLQNLGKSLSPAQRHEAITKLQEMIQTYPKNELKAEFAKLPASVQPSLPAISLNALMEGMRFSLLVALSLTIVILFMATLLPKYPRRDRAQKQSTEA